MTQTTMEDMNPENREFQWFSWFSTEQDGCRATQTDSNGDYSFSVNTAGVYSIYETAVDAQGSCPPGTFAQPAGFFFIKRSRERTIFIENSQINAGANHRR